MIFISLIKVNTVFLLIWCKITKYFLFIASFGQSFKFLFIV